LARTVVEQHFVNPHGEPLTVSYKLPLPADGAVSGFAFELAGERVVGRIEPRSLAREQYEEALIEGRTAALLEEDRSSLFSQEVGNIPPGGDVRIEVVVDHPLKWLAEGAWQWRFPTVVAPRYLGAAGSVADAHRVEVDVASTPLGASARLAIEVRDVLAVGGQPTSPSHALTLRRGEEAGVFVELGSDQGATLDRDVVVAWPVATPNVGIEVDVARPEPPHPRSNSAFALVTVVPPRLPLAPVPRDLIVLIDTSGSMSGEPLDQAKQVVGALIAGLEPTDRLELIEFSMRPRRFEKRPLVASAENKARALAWLGSLVASGGTEMHSGIVEALAPLRSEAQRQVLLVTDGLIGAEERIVREVLESLPRGSRVHTLGIGSGVNRSLTGPVARAGRGSEHIAEVGGDVDVIVERVLAHMQRPVVVDLEVAGAALRSLAGACLPDLMAGMPALLALEVDPNGGELELRGHTAAGPWRERLVLAPTNAGQGSRALPALFARERVRDLELAIAANRGRAECDPEIERLGLDFGISTRLTSWVAVSQHETVDPTRPTRRVNQPHAVAYGMSVAGLGLRAALPRAPAPMLASPMAAAAAPMRTRALAAAPPSDAANAGLFRRLKGILSSEPERGPSKPMPGGAYGSFLPASSRRFTLTGRVVLHKGEVLAIEATLHDAFSWSLPEHAELELADGTKVMASIVAKQSTASGELHAGQTLRLVLRTPGALESAILALVVDDLRIEISER
jgi:Ca-activated chloride channel family protein